MIATFKLRKAQDGLTGARAFAASMDTLAFEPADKEKKASSFLYVGLSGDKGFCGAINSSIVRAVRDNCNLELAAGATKETTKIIIMGERGRGGLERFFKDHFTVIKPRLFSSLFFSCARVSAITLFCSCTNSHLPLLR